MIPKIINKIICLIIISLLLYNILKNALPTKFSQTSGKHAKFDELNQDFDRIFRSEEYDAMNIWYGIDWMKAMPFLRKNISYFTVVSDITRYSGNTVLQFLSSNPELTNKVKSCVNVSMCKDINEVNLQERRSTDSGVLSKYKQWSSTIGLSPMYVGYRQSDGYIDVTWKNNYKTLKEFYLKQNKVLLTTDNNIVNGTKMSGTVIVLEHFDDGNIFHQFKNSGILFYLLSLSQSSSNISIIMTSKSNKLKSSQLWIEAAAVQMITVIDVTNFANRTLVFDTIYKIEPASLRSNFIFSEYLTMNQNPVPQMLTLRNVLISSIPSVQPSNKHVLLLFRHPRYIVDNNTRSFQTIVEELCSMGLNVKIANFEQTSPKEQQYLFRNAAVIIAVHGSELTNMIYLDPSSIVIEITLRYGWCCDPIPKKNQGDLSEPCTSNCRPYHKWDFANLAHSLGLKYLYFDPTYVDPPHSSNPIARNEVHVNSKDLTLLVCSSLVIVDRDFVGFRNLLDSKK